MTESAQCETLVGRDEELQNILAAIRKRNSRLIWGAMHVGKTSLIKAAIAALTEAERRTCIYWTGAASRKQLLSHFVGQLYELGNSFVRKKVHADAGTAIGLNRWLHRQTSLRLRGILFTALEDREYRFFVDHFPPLTHNMARLMKEILYGCKTPIYLAARNYSQDEIGYAWSLYWNDKLRIHLNPLSERASRELLEACIGRFGLASLDLADFREDVLRLSGHLPGSIVKMCELAGHSKYHYQDQVKIKLVHVDYLLQSNPSSTSRTPTFLQ
jgi:hypothetical protein